MTEVIPYGHQTIEDDDLIAVVDALRSGWLTTGPRVEAFEKAFASAVAEAHAVAVNSGTAALHAAMYALKVGPGDEVIVPAITFAATANCVTYQGATPIFADVDSETLLVDPHSVATRLTPRTKAIIAVDYAGQPADYNNISEFAKSRGVAVVADACHSLGANYCGRPVGSLATVSAFSFHPVKPITTAEGGMAVTAHQEIAERMRRFRNHGLEIDFRERSTKGLFSYDLHELGYNYRLSDIQCALGLAQLPRLSKWTTRRQAIAATYDFAFADLSYVRPLTRRSDRTHAYHLYVVELDLKGLGFDRAEAIRRLRALGIEATVHYKPVHLLGLYRERFGYQPGLCPIAEQISERIVTLPIYPSMSEIDLARVIDAVKGLAH